MTQMITRDCFRVYVWNGHWQQRSVCDTADEVRSVVADIERPARVRVVPGTRKVASYTQPPTPTDAQRFREQQSDQMVIRRQALAYYKSGSNGTEVPQLPKG